MIDIKSKSEIELMRRACKIASLAQKTAEKAIKVGMSTYELDQIVDKTIRENGGYPSCIGVPGMFKWAKPYPSATCISVNDEVIHGIPSKDVILKDGDIVSVDLVAFKDGFHGDCARTYLVGNVSGEARRLVEVTKQAFFEGINLAKKGFRIGDISNAIEEYAKSYNLGVVKELVGHGVGANLHEDPDVPNYGKAGTGPILKEGMTIAIEPMLNLGTPKIYILDDDWTIVTRDDKPSAHFEHSIVITKDGYQILTGDDNYE